MKILEQERLLLNEEKEKMIKDLESLKLQLHNLNGIVQNPNMEVGEIDLDLWTRELHKLVSNHTRVVSRLLKYGDRVIKGYER